MNIIKNIKWVALLTFALGYVASTAMSGSEARTRTGGNRPLQPVSEIKANTASTMWKAATISHSLPTYFNDVQPNVINRDSALTAVFDVLCHSGRPLRVLQLGDSHVAGKSYPQAARETLEAAWGKAENDSTGTGVSYSFIGSNGATTQRFATPAYMRRIAEKQPDLIILSFGTNECHGMGYREETHRAQLEDFYRMLTETCPDAVIMMTTPPGDYLTTRSVRYVRSGRNRKRRRVVRSSSRVNPMTVRCAAELEAFGADHGLAVWDLNTIAGGADAVLNWKAASLMRPDRIHFTPEGYALHGHLLGDAILTAYNDYLK